MNTDLDKTLNNIVKNTIDLIDNDCDHIDLNLYEKSLEIANKTIKILYEKLSEDDKETLKICLTNLNKELFKSNNFIRHHYDNGPLFYYSCEEYPKYWNQLPHQYIYVLCDCINCKCFCYSPYNKLDDF